MNKQKSLRVINVLIAILILLLAGTAAFNETIPYNIYSKIHPLIGYLLATFVLLHVYLNFSWIKANYLKPSKPHTGPLSPAMQRQKWLKMINSALPIMLIWLVATALLRKSIPHEIHEVIHGFTGFAMTGLILFHVYLNFGWIKSNYLKKRTGKA